MKLPRLALLASVLPLTMAAATAQTFEFSEYWPVEAGYSWKAVDPSCVDPCACFAFYYEEVIAPSALGPNAFIVGEDINDNIVVENAGGVFTIHGFTDGGVFTALPVGSAVFGVSNDGDTFSLAGANFMLRSWSEITHADKALYGIDPSLDVLVLAEYDPAFAGAANPHNAVIASGLPVGSVPPVGGIRYMEWFVKDVGPHSEMDVEANPAAPNAYGPWPPAMDAIYAASLDCNGNGVIDRFDILNGTSLDLDFNCIPDDCQLPTTCSAVPNASGLPATLVTSTLGSGVGSGLHLECTNGPANEFGFFLVSTGSSQSLNLFDGILCLDLPLGRYNPQIATNQGVPALNSLGQFDVNGVLQSLVGNATSSGGSGFDVPTELPFTPAGQVVVPGTTLNFQCWFRDGLSANFSDVLIVTFP